MIGKRAPPRELHLQQYHHVQQRIASLHLAETLRPTALPHDSALHLWITCKLLLCVRVSLRADATPCYASDMMLVLLYGYEQETRFARIFFLNGLYGYENKEFFHGNINTRTILKFPDKVIGKRAPHRELQLHQYHHARRPYSTAAELHFTRSTAYCIAAPRRNFEADSAAP